MKLAVWTSYYIDLSPEEAVLELKKNGIDAAELSDEHGEMLLRRGDPVEVGREFRKFLEEQNFTMTQGHLWLKIQICSDETAVEKLFRWIDLFEAIGIKNGVLHVDRIGANKELTMEERTAANIAQLKKVEKYLEGRDFRICLENIGGIAASIEMLETLLADLNPANFGICLDTGHLNLAADKDQERFIRRAGDKLHALHIADNEGETDQHMMPFGKGRVKFEKVVRALKEIGYSDLFNLEIPGERSCPLPVRGYKLEYIRKCYDYLMSL